MTATEKLKSFVLNLGIELVGIADITVLKGMPVGLPPEAAGFLKHYPRAIVLGAQYGKLGRSARGRLVSHYMDNAALDVSDYLSEEGYNSLVIRPDEEFDLDNRYGLLSLKVLAKAAGLGWQGRSLLIVSPEYGPVHRWIAVLTDMDLQPDQPIPNQCGVCSLCVDQCPCQALNLVQFDDHPTSRETVLDIAACRGDDSCTVCIAVCPWTRLPSR
jgi:epoxyqueuosine reductase QueG